MSNSNNDPLYPAPVVTNTSPARFPSSEPLIGKHARLEPLTQKHFPDLWEGIGSQKDLWTWWPDEPCKSASEFDKYLGEFLKLSPDIIIYATILLSGEYEGKARGLTIGMSEHRETHRIAEIGMFWGPPLQRSTAATEAIYLLANLLFDCNHRRLAWKTNSLNKASRKAAERYGFVLEGIVRQESIQKGRSRDTALYSILDSEWPLCKSALEKWLDDENFDGEGRQKRRLENIREGLKGNI